VGWVYFPYLLSCLQTQQFEAEGQPSEHKPICQNLHQVVITQWGQQLILAGYVNIQDQPTALEGIDKSIHSVVAQYWQLHLQFFGSLKELHQDLQVNQGFAVSDGSFQDGAGAAAWFIKGPMARSQVIGMIITPGSPEDQSSFRSKLVGIYSILLTLEALTLENKGLVCSCLACDGKSVLDHINLTYRVLQTEPHADLLQAVKTKVRQIGIQINWNHVKGHQDGKLTTVLLQDAWLNVEANLLAKAKVDLAYNGPAHYHLPGEGWVCSLRHQCIVKQLLAKIRAHVNGILAEKYWKTKFCLLDSLWHSIDWSGLGWAYTESSMMTLQWAVKHTLGLFAHGKNMM